MKTLHAAGLVVAAVAITLAIEESRIAALRGIAAPVASSPAEPATAKSAKPRRSQPADPGTAATKSAERSLPATGGDESFGKTVRKMWENPAGKAMMNQGVKMAVALMYEDFIGSLGLTAEENDYLKTLLGKDIADQQELGLTMMSATPEERAALAKEIEARAKENKESIKTFLNSDEDFTRFTDYQNRLPERQQLDGIRAAFAAKQTPLDDATEARLVEAMYQARTTADAPNLTGPDAFTKMADGGLVKTFEQGWEAQEKTLMKEAGDILEPAQLVAFKEYRQQLKEMQLMSMKMAEKMMSGDGGGTK
jgi:hypothetical protein